MDSAIWLIYCLNNTDYLIPISHSIDILHYYFFTLSLLLTLEWAFWNPGKAWRKTFHLRKGGHGGDTIPDRVPRRFWRHKNAQRFRIRWFINPENFLQYYCLLSSVKIAYLGFNLAIVFLLQILFVFHRCALLRHNIYCLVWHSNPSNWIDFIP